MIAALLLAAMVQSGEGAETRATGPASEPTFMIVEFPRGAHFIGIPRRCPDALGADTHTDDEDEICLAELYEGHATVVRHLSGPQVGRRDLLRLTAHAMRFLEGARMMVVTRPFKDGSTTGNFAFWWRRPTEGDDFCATTDELAQWGDNAITREFLRGHKRRFRPAGYSERTDFRCIRS